MVNRESKTSRRGLIFAVTMFMKRRNDGRDMSPPKSAEDKSVMNRRAYKWLGES